MNEARQRHVVRPAWRVDLEVHRRFGAHRYTAYQGCNRMRVPCRSELEARHMAQAWTVGGPLTDQHFEARARGGLPVVEHDLERELAERLVVAVTLLRQSCREGLARLRAEGWMDEPSVAEAARRLEARTFLAALGRLELELGGAL